MIDIKTINISSLEDYDTLLDKITPLYIDNKVVNELKERLAEKCKKILIEYPYRDMDFSSTYSAFHTKNTGRYLKNVTGYISFLTRRLCRIIILDI
jgi:hypothetical protein